MSTLEIYTPDKKCVDEFEIPRILNILARFEVLEELILYLGQGISHYKQGTFLDYPATMRDIYMTMENVSDDEGLTSCDDGAIQDMREDFGSRSIAFEIIIFDEEEPWGELPNR